MPKQIYPLQINEVNTFCHFVSFENLAEATVNLAQFTVMYYKTAWLHSSQQLLVKPKMSLARPQS